MMETNPTTFQIQGINASNKSKIRNRISLSFQDSSEEEMPNQLTEQDDYEIPFLQRKPKVRQNILSKIVKQSQLNILPVDNRSTSSRESNKQKKSLIKVKELRNHFHNLNHLDSTSTNRKCGNYSIEEIRRPSPQAHLSLSPILASPTFKLSPDYKESNHNDKRRGTVDSREIFKRKSDKRKYMSFEGKLIASPHSKEDFDRMKDSLIRRLLNQKSQTRKYCDHDSKQNTTKVKNHKDNNFSPRPLKSPQEAIKSPNINSSQFLKGSDTKSKVNYMSIENQEESTEEKDFQESQLQDQNIKVLFDVKIQGKKTMDTQNNLEKPIKKKHLPLNKQRQLALNQRGVFSQNSPRFVNLNLGDYNIQNQTVNDLFRTQFLEMQHTYQMKPHTKQGQRNQQLGNIKSHDFIKHQKIYGRSLNEKARNILSQQQQRPKNEILNLSKESSKLEQRVLETQNQEIKSDSIFQLARTATRWSQDQRTRVYHQQQTMGQNQNLASPKKQTDDQSEFSQTPVSNYKLTSLQQRLVHSRNLGLRNQGHSKKGSNSIFQLENNNSCDYFQNSSYSINDYSQQVISFSDRNDQKSREKRQIQDSISKIDLFEQVKRFSKDQQQQRQMQSSQNQKGTTLHQSNFKINIQRESKQKLNQQCLSPTLSDIQVAEIIPSPNLERIRDFILNQENGLTESQKQLFQKVRWEQQQVQNIQPSKGMDYQSITAHDPYFKKLINKLEHTISSSRNRQSSNSLFERRNLLEYFKTFQSTQRQKEQPSKAVNSSNQSSQRQIHTKNKQIVNIKKNEKKNTNPRDKKVQHKIRIEGFTRAINLNLKKEEHESQNERIVDIQINQAEDMLQVASPMSSLSENDLSSTRHLISRPQVQLPTSGSLSTTETQLKNLKSLKNVLSDQSTRLNSNAFSNLISQRNQEFPYPKAKDFESSTSQNIAQDYFSPQIVAKRKLQSNFHNLRGAFNSKRQIYSRNNTIIASDQGKRAIFTQSFKDQSYKLQSLLNCSSNSNQKPQTSSRSLKDHQIGDRIRHNQLTDSFGHGNQKSAGQVIKNKEIQKRNLQFFLQRENLIQGQPLLWIKKPSGIIQNQ